jgi:hypothetical protein
MAFCVPSDEMFFLFKFKTFLTAANILTWFYFLMKKILSEQLESYVHSIYNSFSALREKNSDLVQAHHNGLSNMIAMK